MVNTQHGWETFTPSRPGVGNRGVAWPRVTITARGRFGFNKAAHEALGHAEQVEYLYDRPGRRIAFVPTGAENPNAYKMRSFGRGISNRQCGGERFLKHHGIAFGQKSRPHRGYVEDGMLVIELDDPLLEGA